MGEPVLNTGKVWDELHQLLRGGTKLQINSRTLNVKTCQKELNVSTEGQFSQHTRFISQTLHEENTNTFQCSCSDTSQQPEIRLWLKRLDSTKRCVSRRMKSNRAAKLASPTRISAINASFVMFCFSVTRMPFSSRIDLQRASTLSLIRTVLTEIGAIFSLGVAVRWATCSECLLAG